MATSQAAEPPAEPDDQPILAQRLDHVPAAAGVEAADVPQEITVSAYQAGYRPQLGLQGTLPNFNRAILPVVQPDGTTAFQTVRYNNSLLALNLSQNIGLTGGQVVAGTQVQRFDDFISRGRQRVLEERNAFRLSIAELSGMTSRISDINNHADMI